MSTTAHDPENRNLNTLKCKHCARIWHFDDRKAWGENCPQRMEQTIQELRGQLALAESFRFNLEHAMKIEREDVGRQSDELRSKVAELEADKERLVKALDRLMSAVNADQSQLDKASNFDSAYAEANEAIEAARAKPEAVSPQDKGSN